MQTPLHIDPQQAFNEIAAFQRKLAAGMQNLRGLGEQEYANTPREAIYREDKLTVWHMKGNTKPTAKVPTLIVYALVNTVWMTDLQDDRSLVRNLLAQGEDVYLIDWGYPDGADRWLTLDDYLNGYLDRSIDVLRKRHDLDAINLLGICQGGTFSLCYFRTPDNMLSQWVQNLNVDLFVDTLGNVPAELMNWVYLMLKPLRLNQQKYVSMVDILDNPAELKNFLRMERWIFDSPDQAGEAFRQFIKDFYQQNKLIKGDLLIGKQPVDLGMITQPVLNIYANQDHLVPPDASRPLGRHVGTKDYTELAFKGGHIGIYVSGRAQREVAPAIHQWLRERE
jgi:polyhydroxyalkanoate synthase